MSKVNGALHGEERLTAAQMTQHLAELLANPHDFLKLYRQHLPYPPRFADVSAADGVIRFRCFDRPAEIAVFDDKFEVLIRYEIPCVQHRIPLLSRLIHLIHARIDMGCFQLDTVSGSLGYCTSWYAGSPKNFEQTAVMALCWPVMVTNHYAGTFLPLMCGCEPALEDACMEYKHLFRACGDGKENAHEAG